MEGVEGEVPAGGVGAGQGTVLERFIRQSERTPDAQAVRDDLGAWSYAELCHAAAGVRDAVAARGFGPGSSVGVHLGRSREAIAAMLGVWAAEATYVPLDPDYPSDRLRAMCKVAALDVVIGTDVGLAELGLDLPAVDAARLASGSVGSVGRLGRAVGVGAVGVGAGDREGGRSVAIEDRGPGGGGDLHRDPTSGAYVLFTSGSSGSPKGVLVSQSNLTSFVDWMLSAIAPEEFHVVATTISFSFDPFLYEVLGPLLTGGTVRVIPSALSMADIDTEATLLVNTPSVVGELLHAGRFPRSVRTVIVGGERLTAELADEILTCTPVTRLLNTYGPTEATVLATAHDVLQPVTDPVPVGVELPGASVVILDGGLREVPADVAGEICIFGDQVALGYVVDPGAPGHARSGGFLDWIGPGGVPTRMYRTGDVGSKSAAGVVTFIGRSDRQLKLRGYRIEPEEIESVLERMPDVERAAVICTDDGLNSKLRAFVTTHGHAADGARLRRAVKELLPAYMVPSEVLVVSALPTSVNGKVDRDLLHRLEPATTTDDHVHAPTGGQRGVADDTVATVVALSRDILGITGPIDPDDDFLEDLGGSSLALFRLLARMETAFGCALAIERILEDTTLVGLARLARLARLADGGDLSPVHLSVHGDGTACPVFLIHAYLGTALRYRPLGSRLSPDRPVIGIQVQQFDSVDRPALRSIELMATEAVDQILKLRPHGPYLLGGHSAGGLVAYEAARMLRDAGAEVPLVTLIDSPVRTSTAQYLWAEAALNWPDLHAATWAERWDIVRSALRQRLGASEPEVNDDRVAAAVSRSHQASNTAVKTFTARTYGGDVAVLATRQGMVMALGANDLGWGRVVSGEISTAAIPGLHNTLFEEPYVGAVARALDDLLERAMGGAGIRDPNPVQSRAR